MSNEVIQKKAVSWLPVAVIVLLIAGAVVFMHDQPQPVVHDDADSIAWETDFQAALARSAELGRPVLADFTGSDWCRFCIMLHNEVFSQSEFKEFAAENLVLFVADFPRQKEIPDELRQQNEGLAGRYGIQGFPTILILDAEGNELARTGYRRGGVQAYIEHLKELLPQ